VARLENIATRTKAMISPMTISTAQPLAIASTIAPNFA
jgi:hypothetical protein